MINYILFISRKKLGILINLISYRFFFYNQKTFITFITKNHNKSEKLVTSVIFIQSLSNDFYPIDLERKGHLLSL